MSKQRWMTIIGIGLYLFGVAAGVYLMLTVLLAQLGVILATVDTTRPPVLHNMVQCPAVLGHDESGQVTASIPNNSGQPATYRVDFGVYVGPVSLLTLANSQYITVLPHQSVALRWSVSPQIAALSALDALTVRVYAYYESDTETPGTRMAFRSSLSGYCGIGVPRWGTRLSLVTLSLIGMVMGVAISYARYRPLRRRGRIALIAAGVLAALVMLGVISMVFP